MSIVVQIDQIIRQAGVNPYFVTLALVVTLGPVVWKITQGSYYGVSFVIGTLRRGLNAQVRRRMNKAIRGKVRADRMGFYTIYDISIFEVYIAIVKLGVTAGFLMASSAVIYLLIDISYPRSATTAVLLFIIVAGITIISSIMLELQDMIWRKRFQIKNMKKKLIHIQEAASSLVDSQS